MDSEALTIWTVGHSTRTAEEFLALLQAHGIEALADVRRFPGSRAYPHFGQETLSALLEEAGVVYLPMPELGGRRRPRPETRNTIWRNLSFRGYADYMESGEFRAAIERLLQMARLKHTAIMCAELLWWRCHRALISDYLKATGIDVRHIMDETKSDNHPYTSAARIRDGRLTYGPDGQDA